MKKLIFIPTIHEESDSPEVARALRPQNIDALTSRWWQAVKNGIEQLPESLADTKLFAEGIEDENSKVFDLPSKLKSGSDTSIVEDTIGTETEYLKTLCELIKRGATPCVLGFDRDEEREAYGRIARVNDLEKSSQNFDYETATQLILHQLELIDRLESEYNVKAADDINNSLQDGETGILLIGSLHTKSVLGKLNSDISIEFLSRELLDLYKEDSEGKPESQLELYRKTIESHTRGTENIG